MPAVPTWGLVHGGAQGLNPGDSGRAERLMDSCPDPVGPCHSLQVEVQRRCLQYQPRPACAPEAPTSPAMALSGHPSLAATSLPGPFTGEPVRDRVMSVEGYPLLSYGEGFSSCRNPSCLENLLPGKGI